MSRVQQIANQAPPDAQFPRLIAFLQFWKWILPYLRDFIHKKAPYQTYSGGQTGIFHVQPQANEALRIAIAADWGTGTLEADTVAANMLASNPDLTLHLGDVYYMGEKQEIDENCLGQARRGYNGVSWPVRSLGSFALMGNHEMYSGGQSYFTEFLPRLGLLNAHGTVSSPQSSSFFCLETPEWRILGLDTGYHSGGIPALSRLPGVNYVPFFDVDARFDKQMLAWLKQTIEVLQPEGRAKKPTLVLTHHQPISAFEHAYEKPATQLADMGFLDGQQFVWLYGHEHRLTIYNQQTLAKSLQVYPRCIGHGGMPVEVTELSQPNPNVLYYDPRQHPIDEQDLYTKVGYNGHVVLILEGANLTIEYHDILNNSVLFTETFKPTGTGTLTYAPNKPPGSPLASGISPAQPPSSK